MVYQVISSIPTCAKAEKQLVAQRIQTFGNLLMQFTHCEVKDKGWSICHHFLGDIIDLFLKALLDLGPPVCSCSFLLLGDRTA